MSEFVAWPGMDARNAVQRIGAVLVIVAGACGGAVYAGHIHIYSGDFNLPIPKPDSNDPYISKGWMDDAIIEVPHHLVISDLDIGISLTHTSAFDLQLFLQSPTGSRICLNMYDFEKEFFKGQDYTNTIFDDQADTPIEDTNAPFTGRFRPRSPVQLSIFNGQNTFGRWKLQIYDAYYYDTGTFNRFELMITAPEPATAILLTFAIGLLGLFKPRRGR